MKIDVKNDQLRKWKKIMVKLDDKQRELNDANEELSDEKNNSINLSSELESKQEVIEGLNASIAQLKQDKIKYIKILDYYKRQSKNKTISDLNLQVSEKEYDELEKKLENMIAEYRELHDIISLMENDEIVTFENGKYKNEIHEVIMSLLSMNVSINKVNDVIRTVPKKLAGKSVSHLSSKRLISKLMNEANFIVHVQVAEAMLDGVSFANLLENCLHGDGTSKYSKHYQNFQVTVKDGRQYLMGMMDMGNQNVQALSKAFDDKIRELAESVALCNSKEVEQSAAELLCSLKSTMSDQDPTNPGLMKNYWPKGDNFYQL